MANVIDAIKILISGDGTQFREDVEKDQATLEGLLAKLHDQDMNLGVNAVQAREKLTEVKDEIEKLRETNLEIKASDPEAVAVIEDVQRRLDEIRNTTADIDVHDEEAVAEIVKIKAELLAIHESYVNLHLDDSAAVLQLDAFRARLELLSNMHVDPLNPGGGGGMGAAGPLFGGINPLLDTILTFLPTISPLAAAATGAVGALGASFAAAGAGALGFGIVAKSNLTGVFDGLKNVQAAQDAYTKATTDPQRKAALQQERDAWKALDEEQTTAVKSLQSFESFWKSFTSQFEKPVLQAFVSGLNFLEAALQSMTPLITSAGNAIADLLNEATSAFKNDAEVKSFFDFLARDAGPSILAFGQSFGFVMKGIMSLLTGFGPLATDMQGGLVGMTQRFAEWSASLTKTEGFHQFLDYVRANGPQVLALIGNLAKIIVDLLTGMAPVGAILLPLINDILGFTDGILKTNPALVEFGAAFASAFGILKFLSPALTAVTAGYTALKTAITATTVATEGLAAAEATADALNPLGWIVLVVAAVAGLAAVIYTHWDAIKTFFVNAWNGILEFFKTRGQDLLYVIPIVALVTLIVKHWNEIKTFTVNIFNEIAQWLSDLWNGIVQTVASIGQRLVDTWNSLINGIQSLWSGFVAWISNLTHELAQDVVAAFEWMYNHNYYFKDSVDFIVNAYTWLRDTSAEIWNGIKSAWQSVVDAAHTVSDAIVTFFRNSWSELTAATESAWSATKQFTIDNWNAIYSWLVGVGTSISNFLHTIFDPVAAFFSGVWSASASATNTGVNAVRQYIADGLGAIHNAITSLGTSISTFFTNMWNEAAQWGSNLIHMMAQGIENTAHEVTDSVKNVAHKIADFLGFHSPTKDGPASDSDTWAPNFIKMFAGGLAAGAPHVDQAANTLITPLMQRVQGGIDYIDKVLKTANTQQRQQYEAEKKTLEGIYTTAQNFDHQMIDAEKKYQEEIAKIKTDALQKEQAATDAYKKNAMQVETDLMDARKAAADQYAKDVQSINDSLQQSIQQAWASYNSAVTQRSDQLLNPSGIFNAVQQQAKVSADGLMRSLQSQVTQLEQWSGNVQSLSKRGVDKGMIEAIQQMGPQSAAQVKALTSMTDDQLKQYVALWKRKQQDANTEATTELAGLKKQTQEQIAQLQAAASANLDELTKTYNQKLSKLNSDASKKLGDLKTAWETAMTQIEKDTTDKTVKLTLDYEKQMTSLRDQAVAQFKKLGEDGAKEGSQAISDIASAMGTKMTAMYDQAKSWGSNLVNSMITGMQSASSGLATAASQAADQIHDFLGFHSPSKKGAGATADKWMPNMMQMLISGVEQYTPVLQKAISTVIVTPNVRQMMLGGNVQGGVRGTTSSPNITLTMPLTIQGNVYGVEDLQKTVQALMKEQAVPILIEALRPASRSMG